MEPRRYELAIEGVLKLSAIRTNEGVLRFWPPLAVNTIANAAVVIGKKDAEIARLRAENEALKRERTAAVGNVMDDTRLCCVCRHEAGARRAGKWYCWEHAKCLPDEGAEALAERDQAEREQDSLRARVEELEQEKEFQRGRGIAGVMPTYGELTVSRAKTERALIALKAGVKSLKRERDDAFAQIEKLQAVPSYDELLNYVCDKLNIPGCPTFYEAVETIKKRLG